MYSTLYDFIFHFAPTQTPPIRPPPFQQYRTETHYIYLVESIKTKYLHLQIGFLFLKNGIINNNDNNNNNNRNAKLKQNRNKPEAMVIIIIIKKQTNKQEVGSVLGLMGRHERRDSETVSYHLGLAQRIRQEPREHHTSLLTTAERQTKWRVTAIIRPIMRL